MKTALKHELHVADAKCGKTRTSESRLVLVLLLIGWKSGASFLSQSRNVVNAKPITFRHSNHSNENRSNVIMVTSSLPKCAVFKSVCAWPAFWNSSGLKSVFQKLRFRDGLVWTVRLTIETKLRFHISLAWRGQFLCGMFGWFRHYLDLYLTR